MCLRSNLSFKEPLCIGDGCLAEYVGQLPDNSISRLDAKFTLLQQTTPVYGAMVAEVF
jgi:hypothetical protein